MKWNTERSYANILCMKKAHIRIYIVQLAVLALLSAGWWGLLYPNFSMTQDTFHALSTENDSDVILERKDAEDAFFDLLEAEPGKIRIKSRLLDAVAEIRGKENGSK